MYYKSTRNSNIKAASAAAITQGLSEEGGLFVPESLPTLTQSDLKYLGKMKYSERAHLILKKFLTDFNDDELRDATSAAYGSQFCVDGITELHPLTSGSFILELFHGPTCAFKDMALQLLPHLMTRAAEKCENVRGKNIAVLTATSGDTGKAALEGFRDVPGTSVTVFYPEYGVSEIQKRQMRTQEGANVRVCAVKGNFDDCQTGVKEIFADGKLANLLAEKNMMFSSANSINWGRLVPQIVYYISAYTDMVQAGQINQGEPVNICVPTGNFGNILAAYYAKNMGLPVGRLICASNSNNALTDVINTGIYDRNRELVLTSSPSMDILISSNFERLIYHLADCDDGVVNGLFAALKTQGRYELPAGIRGKLGELFYAGWCSEKDMEKTIKTMFNEHLHLLDPHTAIACKIYTDYKKATGDNTKTLITATASPYKFCTAVYRALEDEFTERQGDIALTNEFMIATKLEDRTKIKMPEPLRRTENLPVRFSDSAEKNAMKQAAADIIKSL